MPVKTLYNWTCEKDVKPSSADETDPSKTERSRTTFVFKGYFTADQTMDQFNTKNTHIVSTTNEETGVVTEKKYYIHEFKVPAKDLKVNPAVGGWTFTLKGQIMTVGVKNQTKLFGDDVMTMTNLHEFFGTTQPKADRNANPLYYA